MNKRNIEKINKFKGTKRQMLTAVQFVGYIRTNQVWLFKCDCGNTIRRQKSNFLVSTTNSCGCVKSIKTHGMSYIKGTNKRIPEYRTWVQMRQRCNNPNNPDFNRYGGRGIKICDRWKSFDNFYSDMGKRPEKYTLDRMDNNGDYSPENCRWANRREQSINRECTVFVTYNGKTMSLSDWVNELPFKITLKNLYERIVTNKWPIEKAFTTIPKQ